MKLSDNLVTVVFVSLIVFLVVLAGWVASKEMREARDAVTWKTEYEARTWRVVIAEPAQSKDDYFLCYSAREVTNLAESPCISLTAATALAEAEAAIARHGVKQ